MKFKDKETGLIEDLTAIQGCSYHDNNQGMLFEVNYATGTCWSASPRMALQSLLERENNKVIVHCHQDEKELMESHRKFKEEYHLNALERIMKEKTSELGKWPPFFGGHKWNG